MGKIKKHKASHKDTRYKSEHHFEKNKVRKILKQLKDHPMTMNNAPMLARLQELQTRIK